MINRFEPVLFILGILILGFGCLMLVPLSLSWLSADGAHGAYDEAVLITIASGALLSLSVRRQEREMRVREGFLLVALIWSLLPAFGALPLCLHVRELSWTVAYFEAVSVLSATGAKVLSGLDRLPRSTNFWRTFMHCIGGLGGVVLAVAILPMFHSGYLRQNAGVRTTSVGTFLIFILATVQIIVFGWHWGIKRGFEEAHQGASIRIPAFFGVIMKWVCPAFLLLIFALTVLTSLFGFDLATFKFGSASSYVIDLVGGMKDGKALATNQAAQLSVALVLIIFIFFGLLSSRSKAYKRAEKGLPKRD